MLDPGWAPCPRCQSARVRYSKPVSPLQKWSLVFLSAIGIPAFLVMGILLPCLWAGIPMCIVFLVLAFRTRPYAVGTCRDCQHTWDATPASPQT